MNRINEEFRCIKRTDLIKAMAKSLPMETIRTGCQVLSIELDPVTQYPQLVLSNGSTLKAKVYVCLLHIPIYVPWPTDDLFSMRPAWVTGHLNISSFKCRFF